MTEEEEIAVITRVLDGDTDAFSALVTNYQGHLIQMLYAILQDHRRLAEEVAQDVFVEAFRRLRDFDPARSRFRSWLFMIGRSRGINALRKKRPILVADPLETGHAEPDSNHGGIARDELAALDQALHALPPKQKRAFVLSVIDELPQGEVAQIEGVSIGTIKSRVSRAREHLRTTLNTLRES